ncbi:MAG: alpha/beta fold hydrolase [Thermomicrobiales bacterium]
MAGALTGNDVRLTLPDARGHGASPMISGGAYPASELAADALAVLDAEGLTETHVAAVGWGAVGALGLAATAPERVASLVLAAPYVPGLFTDHATAQLRGEHGRHLAMLQDAATASAKGQTDRALDLFLGDRSGEGWRDQLPKPRAGAIRRSAGNLAPLLAGLAADSLSQDALGRIGAPTTILVSEQASALDRDMVERLASLLSRASIERILIDDDLPSPQGSEWLPALARALAKHCG